MKITTIQRWGNSYAVRLPAAAMQRLNLKAGQAVRIEEMVRDSGLRITPIAERVPTLKELLAQVTPENRHEALEWGAPIGKEVW